MAEPFPAPFADHPSVALVGREREQTALREALAAARAGRGALVLIGGEAGIGKTTLAEALLTEATAHGALALVGRCYDLTETPPYGPWLEVTRAYPMKAPGLPPLPAALTDRSAFAAITSQAALFDEVLAWFVTVAAARPLVVLLDDLHWADPASLDLLRVVARRVGGVRLLLLITYRSDELTRRHPLYALLPLLDREAHAARLNLRRLTAGSVRELVAARYAMATAEEAHLVAWLSERAEGNAFFTTQLLWALEDEGVVRQEAGNWVLGDLTTVGLPLALRQVLDARLVRLGEAAQRLLTVAAVIGQEVPLALWAVVAETDEDGLLDTIERAVVANLLAESPDGNAVRFAHALVREALYAGLLVTRRRRVHRQVGETLTAFANADPDAVAYHFQQAGDARAAGWLVRAGDHAERSYAWQTAMVRFKAALALSQGDALSADERGWTLVRLAALLQMINPSQALGHLAEADEAITEGGDALLGPYATLVTGLVHCNAGAAAQGIAELAAGVAQLETFPAEQRADLARVPLSVRLVLDDDGVGILVLREALAGHALAARARGERVIAATPGRTAGRSGEPPRSSTYAGLSWAYWILGQPDAAIEANRTATVEYRASGHYYLLASTYRVQLDFHWRYFAEARSDRAQLVADLLAAVALTSEMPGRSATDYLSRTLLLEGRWAELRSPQNAMPHWTMVQWVQLARYRGDLSTAWVTLGQFFARGAAETPGNANFIFAVELQQIAVALALDTGDLLVAHEWLVAHDHWLAWAEAVFHQSERQALWSEYHRQAGDPALARRHAEQALAHATTPRQPLALLAAHRLLGELHTAAGHFAEAADHLAQALALADACAAPYERALTLLARAELFAATGDHPAAMADLAVVQAICEPLAARPALARADALAARLAALPPTPASRRAAPAFGLTAREVEVLHLIAQGLPNADIAARLFVSTRTIEQHLRAIYGKLGVENRTAAARLAVEHGLA